MWINLKRTLINKLDPWGGGWIIMIPKRSFFIDKNQRGDRTIFVLDTGNLMKLLGTYLKELSKVKHLKNETNEL